MKLSEMKQVLADRNIRLTKSLGQNFLHDANQLRRIVKQAAVERSDKVLEIGPGLGPLTEILMREGGEVLAIEKDARLVDFLRERFPVRGRDRPPVLLGTMKQTPLPNPLPFGRGEGESGDAQG